MTVLDTLFEPVPFQKQAKFLSALKGYPCRMHDR